MMKPSYRDNIMAKGNDNMSASFSSDFQERFKNRISIVSGTGKQQQIVLETTATDTLNPPMSVGDQLPADLSKWTISHLRQLFKRNEGRPHHVFAEDGKTIIKTLSLDGSEWKKDHHQKSRKARKESLLPKLASSSSCSFSLKENNSAASLPHSRSRYVEYQPYTLKDASTFKAPSKLGGLGANLDTEEYLQKLKKRIKQVEYANAVRLTQSQTLGHPGRLSRSGSSRNSTSAMSVPDPTAASNMVLRTRTTANDIEEANCKRERMLAYGKNVPKPKISKHHSNLSSSSMGYNGIGLKLPSLSDRKADPIDPIIKRIQELTTLHEQNKSLAHSIKSALHM